MENGGVGLKEWGISRMDPCWRLGAVYYVRAWTANQVTKPQKFSIVLQDQHPEGGVRGLPVAAGRRAEG